MAAFLLTCKNKANRCKLYDDMQLELAPQQPLFGYMKFEWSLKDSLCFSESVYVDIKLNKLTRNLRVVAPSNWSSQT